MYEVSFWSCGTNYKFYEGPRSRNLILFLMDNFKFWNESITTDPILIPSKLINHFYWYFGFIPVEIGKSLDEIGRKLNSD